MREAHPRSRGNDKLGALQRAQHGLRMQGGLFRNAGMSEGAVDGLLVLACRLVHSVRVPVRLQH